VFTIAFGCILYKVMLKQKRESIDKALKEFTVPFLREQGFKGSLPHFRRMQSDRINLLTFQHSKYGSKFVVEIANCPVDGITTSWGEHIEPDKCKPMHIRRRYRLGRQKYNTDYWFDYGNKKLFSDVYKNCAKEVIKLLSEAEEWWKEDSLNGRAG
jgi:hypothetical protein